MASNKYVSLLELLDEADDSAEDNEILNRLKLVAQEHMPEDWIEWQVLSQTKEDVFGNEVDSEVLDAVRFCLPPGDVVKAFRPDATDLSENDHKDIKLKMINWAFTRALITKPLDIANKIRGSAEAAESFNEATSSIGDDVKETGKNLESEPSDSSSECGRKRPGPSGSNGPSKKSRAETHTEDTLSFINSTTAILDSMPRPRPESSSSEDEDNSDEEGIAINRPGRNQGTASTSTQSATPPEASSVSTSPRIIASTSPRNPASTSQRIPASTSQRIPASTAQRIIPGPSERLIPRIPQRIFNTPPLNFSPDVGLGPPRIPAPSTIMSTQGVYCQRFGTDGWSRIRYKEVEKRLRAAPVFGALKVNTELRGLGFQPSSALAKQDGMLGTITHGLLCQRKAVADILKDVVNGHPETHNEVKKLLTDSEFQKTSDDILQYVCGQRAYVIEERRKEFKARNRALGERLADIPPTTTHLFDERRLSELVENVGGPPRMFYTQQDNPNKQTRGPGGQFRRKTRRR